MCMKRRKRVITTRPITLYKWMTREMITPFRDTPIKQIENWRQGTLQPLGIHGFGNKRTALRYRRWWRRVDKAAGRVRDVWMLLRFEIPVGAWIFVGPDNDSQCLTIETDRVGRRIYSNTDL